MNESLDQQAGHSPAPLTGSRQVGQSWGSATSTTRPKLARNALVSQAKRLGSTPVVSPCIGLTLTLRVANLNGVERQLRRRRGTPYSVQRRLCVLEVVMQSDGFTAPRDLRPAPPTCAAGARGGAGAVNFSDRACGGRSVRS